MNKPRMYIVMCDRAHCSYPVAVCSTREDAELYAGWCNRMASWAEYRVTDVPFDPLTPAMRAAKIRADYVALVTFNKEKARTT